MTIVSQPGYVAQNGASAYEIAILNGFVGTEEEWLDSLEGPIGPTGGVYTHTQVGASTTRTMVHNLGYNPNYIAMDDTGRPFIALPSWPDTNTMVLTLSAAAAGVAYLS